MRIREATLEDAASIIKHSKITIGQGRNLLTSPNEFTITLDEEIEWITENMNKRQLILVAEKGTEIIGMLTVRRGSRERVKHICHFGISIQEAYCNLGLGSKMIQHMLLWAAQDSDIEKVCLEVFTHNQRAIHVYEKLGFKIEGKKERHVKFEDGTYCDELLMSQFVK